MGNVSGGRRLTWPNPPFDVVETDRFTAQAVALAGSIERWDEIKETIDLDLARNPTIFPEIRLLDFALSRSRLSRRELSISGLMKMRERSPLSRSCSHRLSVA